MKGTRPLSVSSCVGMTLLMVNHESKVGQHKVGHDLSGLCNKRDRGRGSMSKCDELDGSLGRSRPASSLYATTPTIDR
jgi:hypothetical protein